MAEKKTCDICDKTCTNGESRECEDIITCSSCDQSYRVARRQKRRKEKQLATNSKPNVLVHYSCLGLPKRAYQVVSTCSWQCSDCKMCELCHSGKNETKLLCCDGCDQSYHTFCLKPKLEKLPKGEWLCTCCELKYNSSTSPPKSPTDKSSSTQCSNPHGSHARKLSLSTSRTRFPGKLTRSNSSLQSDAEQERHDSVSSSHEELSERENANGDGESRRNKRIRESIELQSDDSYQNKSRKLEDGSTTHDSNELPKSGETSDKMGETDTGENLPTVERRVTNYRKSCPTPGCNGSGHSKGVLFSHYTKSGCPLLHKTKGKRKHHLKKLPKRRSESPRRSQRKPIPISSALHLTRTLKVSIPSLPKKYTDGCSKAKQGAKTEVIDDANPLVVGSTSPISAPCQTKIVFTKEEEEKLKNLVTENDFNMFINAKEKAAKMVGTVEPTSTSCNVRRIELGMYDIDAWYSSPYPQEYFHLPKVYLCEFCLKYMKSLTILRRHMAKCSWRYPPGDEIYRKGNISFFEVNGKQEKTYCQNLCLLAKLFLDHKTLYYDVEPFLFYVLTQRDSTGCHLIGYFSKEKKSRLNYNVSCILCLPPHMRRGFGKMLVAFSYLLSRAEGKTGSPEKPLSDLGLISYRSYWKEIVLGFLNHNNDESISIKDISSATGINSTDIISTLQYLGMLKYWKGTHIILIREDLFNEYREKIRSRPPDYGVVDANCLKWIPPDKREDKR